MAQILSLLDGVAPGPAPKTRIKRNRWRHEGVSAVYRDFFYRFSLTGRESVGVGRVAACEDLGAVRVAARVGGADALRPTPGLRDAGGPRPAGRDRPLRRSVAARRHLSCLHARAPAAHPRRAAAALDPRAEADLYARFAQLLGALLISHRLGSARLADRTLVPDGGRIAEDGTHEQRLTRGGVYARMWEAGATHRW